MERLFCIEYTEGEFLKKVDKDGKPTFFKSFRLTLKDDDITPQSIMDMAQEAITSIGEVRKKTK